MTVYYKRIRRLAENVTCGDIVRVANKLLSSPVSVAARGNISKLPSHADIQAGIASQRIQVYKRAQMP